MQISNVLKYREDRRRNTFVRLIHEKQDVYYGMNDEGKKVTVVEELGIGYWATDGDWTGFFRTTDEIDEWIKDGCG